MRNPLPELCREGLRMIVVVAILDSISKGISLFPAWCIPSLHRHSFNGMIFTLDPHIIYGSRIITATCMRTMRWLARAAP